MPMLSAPEVGVLVWAVFHRRTSVVPAGDEGGGGPGGRQQPGPATAAVLLRACRIQIWASVMRPMTAPHALPSHWGTASAWTVRSPCAR